MTEPKYKIIANFIEKKISNNIWKEGYKIPSEILLAEKFSASRMTARKAIDRIAALGLLVRVPSIGTFVNVPIAQSSLLEIKNIADEIQSRGHSHRMVVLSKMKVHPNIDIALALSTSDDPSFRVVILHYENDIPLQLEERFVNAIRVPLFLEQDLSKITTHEYLSSVAPLTEAQITVEAIQPSNTLRQRLKLNNKIPCLKITRITYSHKSPISFAILYYPGNRYKLTSDLKNLL